MSRCLKVLIKINDWRPEFSHDIQRQAQKTKVEGQIQLINPQQLKLIVCGKNDQLDEFIDYIFDLFISSGVSIEALEPFLKERDYRGIFRIIC